MGNNVGFKRKYSVMPQINAKNKKNLDVDLDVKVGSFEQEKEKNFLIVINYMKDNEVRKAKELSKEVMKNLDLVLKRGAEKKKFEN